MPILYIKKTYIYTHTHTRVCKNNIKNTVKINNILYKKNYYNFPELFKFSYNILIISLII